MATWQVYHNHSVRAKPSATFAWAVRSVCVKRGGESHAGRRLKKKGLAIPLSRLEFSSKSERCPTGVQTNQDKGRNIEPV
jgi:hypothetical protein